MDTSEKDLFLEHFYNTYIRWLVYPFQRNDKTVVNIDPSIEKVSKLHICEILSFCVSTHGYRSKYFVFRGDIISRLLQLTYEKDKHLILGMYKI